MPNRLLRCLCRWLCRHDPPPSPPPSPPVAPPAPGGIPDRTPPAARTRRVPRPSVVLYLPGMAPPVDASDDAVARALAAVPGWTELLKAAGGPDRLAPRAVFRDPEGMDRLLARAQERAQQAGRDDYRPLDHRRHFVLSLPKDGAQPPLDAYCGLKARLQALGGQVYLSPPTRGAAVSNGYAGPSVAGGIGAQGLVSGHSGLPIDGAGQWLVDVERAWITLSPQMVDLPTLQPVKESLDPADIDHGTAVAGIVLGAGGDAAVPGLAPAARFHKGRCLAALESLDPDTVLAAVIADAAIHLLQAPAGQGVLLIQQETWDQLPVESQPLEFAVIQAAALAGHLVIEPAGNGGIDLDSATGWVHGVGGALQARSLDPAVGGRSGALVVAAGCSGQDPLVGALGQCHPASNFGGLVDTWAWGDSIATLGASVDANGQPVALPAPGGFGGTSGAAAIVAGAAVLLLQLRAEAGPARPPLTGDALRALLSSTPPAGSAVPLGLPGAAAVPPGLGTLQGVVMPDLVRLQAHLGL